jgi:hypothetical protein
MLSLLKSTLKVAVSQRGWDTSAPELGQAAYRSWSIYCRDSSEAEQATISDSADVGVGIGLVQVLRA